MTRATLDGLTVPGPSPVHRLAPHTKTVAALAMAVTVVSTPREAWWAFAGHALVLGAVARAARVPLRTLARRCSLAAPFVAFAFLLPFIGSGERVEVLGVAVSAEGLWAAWNVLAKAVLGLAATVLLVSTTPPADLVRGLERLRIPATFTAIAGFTLRYVEVIGAELRRMQVARVSRAHDPRWLWQARAVASTAGTLFVRSFERGERVHVAMVSRGHDGTFRHHGTPAAGRGEWALALSVPALGAALAATAWVLA